MKGNKDLQEQRAFDKEAFSEGDERLYTMLFEELSKEDELVIKPNFAPDIVAKLNKKRRREQRRENFLFAGAIIMVLIITVGGLEMAKSVVNTEKVFLQKGILIPLITLVGLITVFQVVDKMYIRNQRFKRLKRWQS